MNPFKYGQVVFGNDYCHRKSLEIAVLKHVESCQNIYVEGERRTGKTSLVMQSVNKLKDHLFLHIDLFQIKDISDIYQRILDSMLLFHSNDSFLKRIMESIKSLRPLMSYDTVTGNPSISIMSQDTLLPNNLVGLLDLIARENKGKKLIVFFDEFQDIMNLKERDKILAVLRSQIQLHNKITYIYSGSIRKDMHTIFYDSSSPFFKSAMPVLVENIDEAVYCNFIIKKFNIGKRKIDKNIILNLFKISNNIPGDIQELCNVIWDVTSYGETITDKHIPLALLGIYSRERLYYESIINVLTSSQVICLKALAYYNGESIYSKNFLEYCDVRTPSSITRSVERLIFLKVIYKNNNIYKFINPFFKSWLLKRSI